MYLTIRLRSSRETSALRKCRFKSWMNRRTRCDQSRSTLIESTRILSWLWMTWECARKVLLSLSARWRSRFLSRIKKWESSRTTAKRCSSRTVWHTKSSSKALSDFIDCGCLAIRSMTQTLQMCIKCTPSRESRSRTVYPHCKWSWRRRLKRTLRSKLAFSIKMFSSSKSLTSYAPKSRSIRSASVKSMQTLRRLVVCVPVLTLRPISMIPRANIASTRSVVGSKALSILEAEKSMLQSVRESRWWMKRFAIRMS